MDTQTAFLAAYLDSMQQRLREGIEIIEHCLGQLDNQQTWWRPDPSMNSICNLLLHLSGNIRQWLISGISESTDTRDRASEFSDRSQRDQQLLLSLLRGDVDEACEAIARQSIDSLLQVRRVQEFDVNGLETIADSVSHFRGHVQEIVHLTRVLKRQSYQMRFVPQSEASPPN